MRWEGGYKRLLKVWWGLIVIAFRWHFRYVGGNSEATKYFGEGGNMDQAKIRMWCVSYTAIRL